MRTIKKYPNRRLYDTEDSKYITLEDISVLVFENKEFVFEPKENTNKLIWKYLSTSNLLYNIEETHYSIKTSDFKM